jgi:hypothetical protein
VVGSDESVLASEPSAAAREFFKAVTVLLFDLVAVTSTSSLFLNGVLRDTVRQAVARKSRVNLTDSAWLVENMSSQSEIRVLCLQTVCWSLVLSDRKLSIVFSAC